MDTTLREVERDYSADPSLQNEATLVAARKRAGWELRYVECKRCNSETRCVRSHGRAALCDECGGQGWTDVIWVPPESEQERYKNPPPQVTIINVGSPCL